MDFDEIYDELKSKISELAKLSAKKYAEEAKQDANDFLESSKEKLKKWTKLLAAGEISTDEFEWLVNSQQSLAQMKVLTQAGLAQIRVDQFKQSVLNIIVDVIFDKIL
ncbi:MAG: hypothetical protein ABJH98_11560 [Reichenbachiella sp.]|uniref:hypothetical protein n=1 Tax=Reichenbachiella sp. TaxID=2184521 RepID=UPI0032978C01